MLDCRQFVAGLCEYLDSAQGTGGCAEVESHLKACRSCRVVWETTRKTLELYKRLCPACPVPPEVESRLRATMEQRFARRG